MYRKNLQGDGNLYDLKSETCIQIPVLVSKETLERIEEVKGNLIRTKFLTVTLEELFNPPKQEGAVNAR